MTTAFALLAKVLKGQAPAKVLVYGACNTLSRWLRTGDRRYEFERLYLEHGDVWDYRSSAYEHRKYQRTLQAILAWRRAGGRALELGCSVGVFTGMLAEHFAEVTAVDVSAEALSQAEAHNSRAANIAYVRSDIRTLELPVRFDVIVCAEVLYYLRERDVERVWRRLDAHLSERGVLITAAAIPQGGGDALHFNDWNEALSRRLPRLFEEDVADPVHPYRIAVFGRPDPDDQPQA